MKIEAKCPLCHDGRLEHRKHKNTHIYVCDMCPLVAFEDVTYEDEANMCDYLTPIDLGK